MTDTLAFAPTEPCCAPGCKDPRGGRSWKGSRRPTRYPARPFGRPGVLCGACHERLVDRSRQGLTGDALWATRYAGHGAATREGMARATPKLDRATIAARAAEVLRKRTWRGDSAWPRPVPRRLSLAAMAPAEAARWIVKLWDRRDLPGLARGVVREDVATNREESKCL